MKKALSIQSISTDILNPGEDLFQFVIKSLRHQPLQEQDILAVTSKIVSLAENRVVHQRDTDKLSLVKKEADLYLAEIGYGCHLTIKHGLVIPSAGIDESNAADDFYILFPEKPFESAQRLCLQLQNHYQLKNLGILLTDSHTTPLRKGVTGISLAHWGFQGVQNLIGKADLFGRTLQMTQVNVADALSAAAVFMMGEAAECTPLAILKNSSVEFTLQTDANECCMPLKEDLYYPLLEKFL